MGIILRIAGVLLVVGACFLISKTHDHFAIDVPDGLRETTFGNGFGSMYRICDSTGPAIEKFTSVDFATKPASDIKNYFYSIQNPKEYLLDRDDAVLVEKGPYALRKYSIKHNISFRESTLTDAEAGSRSDKGAIEFDVANAYVVLDQATEVTSNLKRSTADLSLSWPDGEKETLPSVDAAMPSHLSMSDELTNLSPEYQSALGALNDEFTLVLSLSCTADQIANIPLAGTGAGQKAQCTASEMNDYSETDCSCCMLDEDHTTSTESLFLNCNDFIDESEPAMSTLSLLAYYDGGVAVKEAGETKYDGSGATFIQTEHGQTSFYSPAIQTHTVNDIMFGHPSAFIGKVVPNALLSTAQKVQYDATGTAPSAVDTAKDMLTGQMDDLLPFKLGDVADYTKKVGAVCYSTCEAVDPSDPLYDSPLGWTCTGNAPDRYQTTEADEIVLGGIDCMPYSSTYATTMQCSAIETHLSSNPNDPEYQACACADGSSDWEAEGCCLAAGMLDGQDLTGSGCLYQVAGVMDPNYVGKDATASGNQRKVDLGAAMKAWTTKEPSLKSSLFMCPASGAGLDEHNLFNRYETYQGASEHDAYYYTGRPRIQQDDKSLTPDPYKVLARDGHDNTYHPPKGMSHQYLEKDLNNWISRRVDHPVFLESAKMPVAFKNDQDFGYMVSRPKACGSNKCLTAARMRTKDSDFVWANETKEMGRGLPFSGLQPVGHFDGPSKSGRPAYFHQPLYLHGDEELLSQQNNSHVEMDTTGNGIQIHRPLDDSSDPGQFVVGGTNPNYELVGPDVWSEDNGDNLRSYFDLEAATGITVRSRMRFGKSYSIFECDPDTNDHCALRNNAGTCYETAGAYPCSAANVLTPDVIGGKIIPHHWNEEHSVGASKAEIDNLVGMAIQFQTASRWYIFWFIVGYIAFTFGFMMTFQLMCFEQRSGPAIQAEGIEEKNEETLPETTTTN